MTLHAGQQKRHRCKEPSFGLCGKGKSGMIWEESVEMCLLSYVKQIASPGSMHEAGCSGLVYWDDAGGWDGEHMNSHNWFMSMYGKNHYNIVKWLASN